MDIAHLIAHPEELNKDTLYDLRRLVAVHPTYHAARILFLKNLFLLHDSTFDQELRRAALLVPDRSVLFAITQGTDTRNLPQMEDSESEGTTLSTLSPTRTEDSSGDTTQEIKHTEGTVESTAEGTQSRGGQKKYISEDSTSQFLDNVLSGTQPRIPKRQVKADPSVDYMGYLLQSEQEAAAKNGASGKVIDPSTRMDMLIDDFIERHTERIVLSENPMVPEGLIDEPNETPVHIIPKEEPTVPASEIIEEKVIEEIIEEQPVSAEIVEEEIAEEPTSEEIVEEVTAEGPTSEEIVEEETAEEPVFEDFDEDNDDTSFSETLARAYIKQQKYDRAIEVMNKLHASTDQSNPYFADQVRFLQKLSIASKKRK